MQKEYHYFGFILNIELISIKLTMYFKQCLLFLLLLFLIDLRVFVFVLQMYDIMLNSSFLDIHGSKTAKITLMNKTQYTLFTTW